MCVLINVMSLHKIKEEGDCCQRKRVDLRETRKKMTVYVASGSPLPSTSLLRISIWDLFACLSLKPGDLTPAIYEVFHS